MLFYGGEGDERAYFTVGNSMAYILDTGNGDVRTEGMSYGMMICVQLDKKAEFDRLWTWVKTYMYHAKGSRKGYYSWECKPDGTVIDDGSAPDGEEWFATALFFASGRWGDGTGIYNYRAEANAILDIMLHKGDAGEGDEKTVNMFDTDSKQVRFSPLASWAKVTDPSYHLPAFYELWALWADKDNEFWRSAAEASRKLFHAAANPKTGLMPDYCDFSGKPYVHRGHENFSFDAQRTLANVALDWSWFSKDPWQKAQSNRVLAFLSPFSPTIPYKFTTDGKPLVKDTSTSIMAMAAVAALAADRNQGEPFVHYLWDTTVPEGKYRYYNGMLYMLGLLQCSGRFQVYTPAGKPSPFAPCKAVTFKKFEYKGNDPWFALPVKVGEYQNPILPGFHPDPSICRVGDE
jgi:oligosaccharide reducing-end xylanase